MKNQYETRGNVTAIFLNKKNGVTKATLIDTNVLDAVSQYNWYEASGYVRSTTDKIYLHRLVTSAPNGMVIDHINHDTLDNRKDNLRIVTVSQNGQNLQGARSDNKSSGIRGVWWDKSRNKWMVSVYFNKKPKFIGYYDNLIDAEKASIEARAAFMEFSQEALIHNVDKEKFITPENHPYKGNKSGIRNVYWSEQRKKWTVFMKKNRKTVYIGSYETIDEAKKSAEEARKKLFN